MRITIEDEANNQKIMIERDAINLEEMLNMLEDALRGSGFNFKGHLEISYTLIAKDRQPIKYKIKVENEC